MSKFDPIIQSVIARRVEQILALIERGIPKDDAVAHILATSVLGVAAKGEICDRVNAAVRSVSPGAPEAPQ